MNASPLFDKICTLVFDINGSMLQCHATLNQRILKNRGYDGIDGIVDLDTGKIIPEYLFDYLSELVDGEVNRIGPLDALFQAGGKLW